MGIRACSASFFFFKEQNLLYVSLCAWNKAYTRGGENIDGLLEKLNVLFSRLHVEEKGEKKGEKREKRFLLELSPKFYHPLYGEIHPCHPAWTIMTHLFVILIQSLLFQDMQISSNLSSPAA